MTKIAIITNRTDELKLLAAALIDPDDLTDGDENIHISVLRTISEAGEASWNVVIANGEYHDTMHAWADGERADELLAQIRDDNSEQVAETILSTWSDDWTDDEREELDDEIEDLTDALEAAAEKWDENQADDFADDEAHIGLIKTVKGGRVRWEVEISYLNEDARFEWKSGRAAAAYLGRIREGDADEVG